MVFASSAHFTFMSAPSEEAALVHAIAESGARHVIVGGQPYRAALYTALPRGSVIARFGVGHEWVDKGKATAAGLLCTNTPSVLDQSVAELTFLLVAAAARRLTAIAGAMRDGHWAPQLGMELRGKTLTIVGAGRIGQAVARIAKRGFDMRVIGCRRKGSTAPMPAGGDFDLVTDDLAEAVRPGRLRQPADSRRARERALHQPRPALADAAARVAHQHCARRRRGRSRALRRARRAAHRRRRPRRLRPRALSTRGPRRDLRTLPNVILTPHVGSTTPEANRGMAERAVQNIAWAEEKAFARMDLLNPEVLG